MLKAAVNAAQPNIGTNTPPMQQQQQPMQQASNNALGPMLSKEQYLAANPGLGVTQTKQNPIMKAMSFFSPIKFPTATTTVDNEARNNAYNQYVQNYNNSMNQTNNPQQTWQAQQANQPEKMGYFEYMSVNPTGDYKKYVQNYYNSNPSKKMSPMEHALYGQGDYKQYIQKYYQNRLQQQQAAFQQPQQYQQ